MATRSTAGSPHDRHAGSAGESSRPFARGPGPDRGGPTRRVLEVPVVRRGQRLDRDVVPHVLHPTALGTADQNALLNGIPNPLMAKWNPKSALGGAVPMRFRRCA